MMNEVVAVRPYAVASTRRRVSLVIPAAAILGLGSGVFLWLSDARAGMSGSAERLPALPGADIVQPLDLPRPQTASNQPAAPSLNPVSQTMPVLAQPASPASAAPLTKPAERLQETRQSSALLFDLAQSDRPGSTIPEAIAGRAPTLSDAGSPGPVSSPPRPAGAQPPRALSENEQFSSRVVNDPVEVAKATRIADLDRLVIQGTIMAATMETALNSDLPGFARATIQRDVLSFDGSTTLIPAGSRVIGQYKSGVAQGASRIFIVWTRLIRPDGVSVALASPAIDELGRGGVPGKVDRHFLQRFGGSILLSVLSGGISAATAALSNGSTVVVGTAGEATALAQQAAQDLNIPPTITTKAGASIRIFVARDLDFTDVGPAP